MSTIKSGPWGLWEVEKEGTRELGIWEGLAGKLWLVDCCVLDSWHVLCLVTMGGGPCSTRYLC